MAKALSKAAPRSTRPRRRRHSSSSSDVDDDEDEDRLFAQFHNRRPVPKGTRAIEARWDPWCDLCEDDDAESVAACPNNNEAAAKNAIVEVICTFRVADQRLAYVELPLEGSQEEDLVRSVLERLSTPLAADLVRLSCLQLSLRTPLAFLHATTTNVYDFDTERSNDERTRHWQAFVAAYLAETRPRTRAVAGDGPNGFTETAKAVIAHFRAAGATDALELAPTAVALEPPPGPGRFRVYAFPGVPTADHVTLGTVGLSTLSIPVPFDSHERPGPSGQRFAPDTAVARQELFLTVRTQRARRGQPVDARLVDSLYATAAEHRVAMAVSNRPIAPGSFHRFNARHPPMLGIPGYLVVALALASGWPVDSVVRTVRSPIDLLAVVPLQASEVDRIELSSVVDERRTAAAQRLWQQLRATGADIADLARSAVVLPDHPKRSAASEAVAPPPSQRPRRDEARIAALQTAAKAGDVHAMVAVAAAFKADKDFAKARHLLEQAAVQGDADAQAELAWYLQHGAGGKVDGARAVTLLAAAADQGHADAAFRLGKLLFQGDDGAGISRDAVRGTAYLTKASTLGVPAAATWMGLAYRTGRGVVAPNPRQALHWFALAHARGDVLGSTELAQAYHLGRGTARDTPRAMAICKDAVARGSDVGMAVLGKIHGDEGNWAEAVKCFRHGMQRGSAWATAELGYCYMRGEGVAADKKRGLQLIDQACQAGWRKPSESAIPGAYHARDDPS